MRVPQQQHVYRTSYIGAMRVSQRQTVYRTSYFEELRVPQPQDVLQQLRPAPVGGAKQSELLMQLAEGRGLPATTGLHWLLGRRPRPAAV